MHFLFLKLEAGPWFGLDLRFVLIQEYQGTKIRPSLTIGEGTLPTDTPHLQGFVLVGWDAEEESRRVGDFLIYVSVVLGCVGSKDKASSVVGHDDGGPLIVTVFVETFRREAMNSGLVKQVQSDVAQERKQLLLLLCRQAGCDLRHTVPFKMKNSCSKFFQLYLHLIHLHHSYLHYTSFEMLHDSKDMTQWLGI